LRRSHLTVAPRLWFGTYLDFLVNQPDGPRLTQSDYDSCYFYKIYPDGGRLDMGVYVDDSWVIDCGGAAADADLSLIAKRFSLTLQRTHPSTF